MESYTGNNNQNASIPPAGIYCTKCGKYCDISNNFCSRCGNPLKRPADAHYANQYYNQGGNNNYQQPGNQSGFQSTQDFYNNHLYEFIGKNAHYYINKFNTMTAKGTESSWNWATFLFGTF